MFWHSETDEQIPNNWWKKTNLNLFVKLLKEQPKQRLTLGVRFFNHSVS